MAPPEMSRPEIQSDHLESLSLSEACKALTHSYNRVEQAFLTMTIAI